MFYPGELDAAAQAMEAKRQELIAKPLARIWQELAAAGLKAAASARKRALDDDLANLR